MPQRRSQQWYAGPDPRNNYLHRAWMRRGVPDHVMQADRGVDLDFLVGCSGDTVTRDSH